MMTEFKRIDMNASAFLVVAALTLAPSALATSHQTNIPPAVSSTAVTEGEVRKIDMDAKKITIKHGEIKNLGMPAMTMVFVAQDPALLQKVRVGDSVRFTADRLNGVITVTSIEAAK
jgi:Cu(I)/Ag(I) efflux system periplasmic protein CusF